MKRIAVTGGAGQIAYSILFRLAAGELLGPDEEIALHILDIEPSMRALDGVVMELNDCAYPLLKEVVTGSNPREVFKEVDYAFLVGSKPRGPGMERGDLLKENGKIFIDQGKALSEVASPNCLTLVVGNPCNTNCLIAAHHAENLSNTQFFAMTQLDENRAKSQLAEKSGNHSTDVKRMAIWGNHSATQVPDFTNATIDGKPALDVIGDRDYLENTFIPKVQKRGAEIIDARGKSSAASAAHAAIEAMRNVIVPTPAGESFSTALYSKGNPYGIDENLFFSMPCISKGDGKVEIVPDFKIDDPFIAAKIKATENELQEERQSVSDLL